MGSVRRLTQTADGWRDSPPDLTTGEHDLLSAMLELAWHDVQIDLDSISTLRREEAVAAKVTAYEWITSDEDHVLSFRSVCLHLGIDDVERARRVILRDVKIPDEPVPSRWRDEFASTVREDRSYIKRRKTEPCIILDAKPLEYTLDALVAEISGLNESTGDADALAAWEAAVESEDPVGDDR